jgi:hypothetical protein
MMWLTIEKPIKRYLSRRHGAPANPETQLLFYRCELCHGLVSWNDIARGGCRCGVGSRIRGAHLTTWEKVKALVLPWMI